MFEEGSPGRPHAHYSARVYNCHGRAPCGVGFGICGDEARHPVQIETRERGSYAPGAHLLRLKSVIAVHVRTLCRSDLL